ncbi:metal ABC transporter solute-binding protein, Zn/Mn family [Crystallibacter degradans]|uniref:metal ABC transporter solute-binding protein, Zn/Mn family n=1 Tax=Crystallibacter degradans TaxID=2726743 RepID=UPI003211F8B2
MASTDVYGDLAATIGGEAVEVTSIINKLSQDPHSYEATARDKLAVSEADVVIENGGGYDPFLHGLVDETDKDHDYVVTAVDVSGLGGQTGESAPPEAGDEHAGHGHVEGLNEHVWYDFETMGKMAAVVAEKLSELDPANAATFETNSAAFNEDIDALVQERDALAKRAGNADVAATDPVPHYLLEALGLHNETPADFLQAVEEGSDAAPVAVKETQDLISGGTVSFVAYNEQTEGPQTQQLRALAEEAGVAVVVFTETLPEGQDYVSWMGSNLDNISTVLAA